jgi:uncharacterized RDD family membrane protein YckC
MIQRRLIAWLMDALLALCLWNFLDGILRWYAISVYWLLRDGWSKGQSLGKRLMELKVVVRSDHSRPCRLTESIIRNLLWVVPAMTLVLASGFMRLNSRDALVAAGVVYLILGVSSLYCLIVDHTGRHWGDRLAGTQVIDVAGREVA